MVQDANCKNECDICKLKMGGNGAVQILIDEFDKDPFWGRQKIKELSAQTGIAEIRIYKWNWDRKKKSNL